MKLSDISDKIKFRVLLSICAGMYFTQLAYILKYAVNIPYWDEWEALTPTGFLANPTLSQLFVQHNEHRIVTTKLLTLLLYHIDGWNLITQMAVNFAIYGLLLFTLFYVIRKCVPQLSGWILLGFIIFLLTTIAWENHFWGFQSQFHFSLLFLVSSVFFLFNNNQSNKNLCGGIFFSWLAIYSLSSGLIEILIVVFCFTVFKLLRILQSNDKRLETGQLLAGLFFIGGAIGLYFVGYTRPSQPELTFPYQGEFWTYFFNLFSSGFGITVISILPGLILFLFVIFPVFGEMIKSRLRMTPDHWTIIVLTVAIVSALGAIATGRAGFHSVEQSKSSRYCEIVIMLIPLCAAMWTIFLHQRENTRKYLLLAFWIFCAASFASYLNFSKIYRDNAPGRLTGKQCIENYYNGQGEPTCSTIYPAPIADRLEFSKSLKISFEEEFNNSSSNK